VICPQKLCDFLGLSCTDSDRGRLSPAAKFSCQGFMGCEIPRMKKSWSLHEEMDQEELVILQG
jgi:hypothetical protein